MRGHELFHYTPDRLRMRADRVSATVEPMGVRETEGDHYTLATGRTDRSVGLDVVLLRQDPPFDMAYITTTHMLERIHPADPGGQRSRLRCAIRRKRLLVTEFPELMPETLITRDFDAITRLPPRIRRHHHQAALRQWRGRRLQDRRGRPEPFRAAGDVRGMFREPLDRPALSAGGARGRQAHHPGRRRSGRRDQPRARA